MIEFVQGEFQKFRATSKIHIGQAATDIMEGSTVEFDGQTLKLGGKEYHVPAVRGGVTAGWLVPIEDNISRYIPKPAGVKVRPAQDTGAKADMAMPMAPATEEEQVVGTLGESQARRKSAAEGAAHPVQVRVTEEPPVEVTYEAPKPVPVAPKTAAVAHKPVTPTAPKSTAGTRVDMSVISDSDQNADAVPVGRILKSPKMSTVISDGAQAAAEVRRLDSKDGTSPPKVEFLAPKRSQTHMTKADGEPIGQTHPTGATGDVAEARSGESLEELLPGAASSGLPEATAPEVVTKFTWDLKAHWRNRVKGAMAHVNQPAILKYILAIESEAVQANIKAELSKLGKPIPQ